MPSDYFAILGLAPGRYAPAEIRARFQVERERLLGKLVEASDPIELRRHLDELHLAYAALRDPERQDAYVSSRDGGVYRLAELRALIEASLEDGLLRYSRRQLILERARELGFDEFQTQLVIAQVQYGDEELSVLPQSREHQPQSRSWARGAAVGLLALALFLFLVRALVR